MSVEESCCVLSVGLDRDVFKVDACVCYVCVCALLGFQNHFFFQFVCVLVNDGFSVFPSKLVTRRRLVTQPSRKALTPLSLPPRCTADPLASEPDARSASCSGRCTLVQVRHNTSLTFG